MIKKKSILCFLLALFMIAPTLFLSGCTNRYFAVLSTDKYYEATLTSRLKTANSDYEEHWRVLRKSQNRLGED